MHFRCFEDNARRRGIGYLGRLSNQRIEQVQRVELAQEVDAKVSINTVGVEVEGVRVDAGGQDQLRRPLTFI